MTERQVELLLAMIDLVGDGGETPDWTDEQVEAIAALRKCGRPDSLLGFY